MNYRFIIMIIQWVYQWNKYVDFHSYELVNVYHSWHIFTGVLIEEWIGCDGDQSFKRNISFCRKTCPIINHKTVFLKMSVSLCFWHFQCHSLLHLCYIILDITTRWLCNSLIGYTRITRCFMYLLEVIKSRHFTWFGKKNHLLVFVLT